MASSTEFHDVALAVFVALVSDNERAAAEDKPGAQNREALAELAYDYADAFLKAKAKRTAKVSSLPLGV